MKSKPPPAPDRLTLAILRAAHKCRDHAVRRWVIALASQGERAARPTPPGAGGAENNACQPVERPAGGRRG
jgi:hypothetical protein